MPGMPSEAELQRANAGPGIMKTARFAYDARAPDEHSFQKGTVILTVGECENNEGWYKAYLDGKWGIVPGTHLSDQHPADMPNQGQCTAEKDAKDSASSSRSNLLSPRSLASFFRKRTVTPAAMPDTILPGASQAAEVAAQPSGGTVEIGGDATAHGDVVPPGVVSRAPGGEPSGEPGVASPSVAERALPSAASSQTSPTPPDVLAPSGSPRKLPLPPDLSRGSYKMTEEELLMGLVLTDKHINVQDVADVNPGDAESHAAESHAATKRHASLRAGCFPSPRRRRGAPAGERDPARAYRPLSQQDSKKKTQLVESADAMMLQAWARLHAGDVEAAFSLRDQATRALEEAEAIK